MPVLKLCLPMFIICNISCRRGTHRTCENILCGHVSKRIVRGEGEKESSARGRVLYFQGACVSICRRLKVSFWKLQAFAINNSVTIPENVDLHKEETTSWSWILSNKHIHLCRKFLIVVFNLTFCTGKRFVVTCVHYVCVITDDITSVVS